MKKLIWYPNDFLLLLSLLSVWLVRIHGSIEGKITDGWLNPSNWKDILCYFPPAFYIIQFVVLKEIQNRTEHKEKTRFNVILTICTKSDVQTEKHFIWFILVAWKKILLIVHFFTVPKDFANTHSTLTKDTLKMSYS